jgi:adenosylmethionine-8-amino-7-oxononanoate aminotransferase
MQSIIGDEYDLFIPQLTGSDAVDTAIRLAWTLKQGKIAVRPNSYHSGSIVGWQLSDRDKEFTTNWSAIDWHMEAKTFDNVDDVANTCKENNISAILVDAITWSNGAEGVPDSYWHQLAVLANEMDIPLIADEILTGFGKTGSWSYFKAIGVSPDILVFGKALTAGHEPLALVCVHKRMSEKLAGKWLASGNTKAFNECGAAIALKTINIIKREKLLDRVNNVIVPFLQQLSTDINTTGKVESQTHGVLLELDFGEHYKRSAKFQFKMRKRGYWQRTWKHLYFHLFYNITDDELSALRTNILGVLSEMK